MPYSATFLASNFSSSPRLSARNTLIAGSQYAKLGLRSEVPTILYAVLFVGLVPYYSDSVVSIPSVTSTTP